MSLSYQIFFVPHLKDRKKLSALRQKLCKQCKSNAALQYPVHMSFILGAKIRDYNKFEKDIKKFCKNQKQQTLITSKLTTVLPRRNWSGINIKHTKELDLFRKKIRNLISKYSLERKPMRFIPHITLVFRTDVSKLKKIKNPVNDLLMDRLTIAKKEKDGMPYRILKHIKLKKL